MGCYIRRSDQSSRIYYRLVSLYPAFGYFLCLETKKVTKSIRRLKIKLKPCSYPPLRYIIMIQIGKPSYHINSH